MEFLPGFAQFADLHQMVVEDVRRDYYVRDRIDPFDLTDREFKDNYRFEKDNVEEITNMLHQDIPDDGRIHSMTPLQMVCMTLSALAGDELQRTSARLTGCTQVTVHNSLHKVLDACIVIAPRYVRLDLSEIN